MAGGIFEVQVNQVARHQFSLVDGSGAFVSGQAASVTKLLRNETGAASETLTITEQGTSGVYIASFTPTLSAANGHRYFIRLRGPEPATDGSILEYHVVSFPTAQFSGIAGPLLTNLANLKDYLGGEASGGNDTLLTRLIGVASDAIERYCNRTFSLTTYTAELYDGTGTDTLRLRQSPIVGTPTVLEDGVALTVGENPTGDYDVLVYKKGGTLVRQFSSWFQFRRYYSVTYDAGYSTIPAAVEQAALDLAALMYKERDRIGLNTKNLGQQGTSYLRKLPEHVLMGLKPYRRLSMGIAA